MSLPFSSYRDFILSHSSGVGFVSRFIYPSLGFGHSRFAWLRHRPSAWQTYKLVIKVADVILRGFKIPSYQLKESCSAEQWDELVCLIRRQTSVALQIWPDSCPREHTLVQTMSFLQHLPETLKLLNRD